MFPSTNPWFPRFSTQSFMMSYVYDGSTESDGIRAYFFNNSDPTTLLCSEYFTVFPMGPRARRAAAHAHGSSHITKGLHHHLLLHHPQGHEHCGSQRANNSCHFFRLMSLWSNDVFFCLRYHISPTIVTIESEVVKGFFFY